MRLSAGPALTKLGHKQKLASLGSERSQRCLLIEQAPETLTPLLRVANKLVTGTMGQVVDRVRLGTDRELDRYGSESG